MKIKNIKTHLTIVKLLSTMLIISMLITTYVFAESSVPVLRQVKFYLESCNEAGFIESNSSTGGVYASPNGYNYSTSQLWTIKFVSAYEYLNDGDYCAIQSSTGDYLYLRTEEIDNTTYYHDVALGYYSNFYSLPDNYLWKVKKIGTGIFYDIYTLCSKKDETKYLISINGYVNFAIGLGVGREEITRHWLFHDNIGKAITNSKAIYDGYDEDRHLKPISFANIYDKIETYGTSHYFGAYIDGNDGNTNVVNSCKNIGASKIREYDGFNARGLTEIISESSVCVISTHGSTTRNGILCRYYETNNNEKTFFDDETMVKSYIDDLHVTSNYFNGTKCILLMACEGARDTPNSFADSLHNKGVQSVVAFKTVIDYFFSVDTGEVLPNTGDNLFTQRFLNKLGQGNTISGAADISKDSQLNGNFGLDSCEVIGNGALRVKS